MTDFGLFLSISLLLALYILNPTSSKKLFAGLFATVFFLVELAPLLGFSAEFIFVFY